MTAFPSYSALKGCTADGRWACPHPVAPRQPPPAPRPTDTENTDASTTTAGAAVRSQSVGAMAASSAATTLGKRATSVFPQETDSSEADAGVPPQQQRVRQVPTPTEIWFCLWCLAGCCLAFTVCKSIIILPSVCFVSVEHHFVRPRFGSHAHCAACPVVAAVTADSDLLSPPRVALCPQSLRPLPPLLLLLHHGSGAITAHAATRLCMLTVAHPCSFAEGSMLAIAIVVAVLFLLFSAVY